MEDKVNLMENDLRGELKETKKEVVEIRKSIAELASSSSQRALIGIILELQQELRKTRAELKETRDELREMRRNFFSIAEYAESVDLAATIPLSAEDLTTEEPQTSTSPSLLLNSPFEGIVKQEAIDELIRAAYSPALSEDQKSPSPSDYPSEAMYPAITVSAKLGKRPALLYRLTCVDQISGLEEQKVFAFQFHRKLAKLTVYACSYCKTLKKYTPIKVFNDQFLENPAILGHVCTPKDWAEESLKRDLYKSSQESKRAEIFGFLPKVE